jgi:hypothetical protein
MSEPHWLRTGMSDDPVDRVKHLIRTFGGSFPATGQGLINVIEGLEAASVLPPALAAHAGRWPVRAVGAFLPVLDGHPLDLVKFCGLGHISVQHAVGIVESMGYWSGEPTPQVIRQFLVAITNGEHPDAAARRLGITEDEQTALDFLLETRQHWHNSVLDRVFFVRANGGGWWKTARELGTFRPGIVNSWIRAYDHYAATGIYPEVEPLIEIPDGVP